jgi:hypothetical protein
MDRRQRTEQVRRLLDEAGRPTDGADASEDWVIPLATRVRRRLDALLGTALSDARLVALLVQAGDERQLIAPERPWSTVVADLLVERFVAEPGETLALYYVPGCPQCRRVLADVDRLEVQIELRNIWESHRYRHELLHARGSTNVPVLQCSSPAGERWVADARAIVADLERRAAEAVAPA